MLTYQCGQCGRRLRSSHKPKRCGDCGGERFFPLRDGGQSQAPSRPKARLAPPLPPALFLEPAPKKPKKQRETNLDSIWSLPDFFQIAGWSLGLLLVGGAFGYGLYRLSGSPVFPRVEITEWIEGVKAARFQDKDDASEQAALTLDNQGESSRSPNSVQSQAPEPTAPTEAPTLALRRYYQSLNQSNNGDRLDLAYRVEVYGEKVLRANSAEAAVKLGLRYYLKNGETLCESRLFSLRRAPGQSGWEWARPLEIRPQPQCQLP